MAWKFRVDRLHVPQLCRIKDHCNGHFIVLRGVVSIDAESVLRASDKMVRLLAQWGRSPSCWVYQLVGDPIMFDDADQHNDPGSWWNVVRDLTEEEMRHDVRLSNESP